MRTIARRALKRLAIQSGLEAVGLSRLANLWPSAAGRGVIFTLHNVAPATQAAFAPNALLSITPEFLAQAIERCRANGLTPVPLHALPRLIADPRDERRFVAFTLDDGYRDNAEFAAPVFTRYGVPFTIFITKGFVTRSRTMWWRTIEAVLGRAAELTFDFGAGPDHLRLATPARKLAAFERFAHFVGTTDEDEAVRRIDALATQHGIDPMDIVERLTMDAADLRTLVRNPLVTLGAHTVNHVNLRRVAPERLDAEIVESAAAVGDFVDRYPPSFCYPYGGRTAAGEREFAATARRGFAVAVTTRPDTVSARHLATPTALPRVSLNGLYQKGRYVDAMISGVPFRALRSGATGDRSPAHEGLQSLSK